MVAAAFLAVRDRRSHHDSRWSFENQLLAVCGGSFYIAVLAVFDYRRILLKLLGEHFMNSVSEQTHYIAPLKYNWLTSFYDPLLRWTMPEDKFKRQLMEQAKIAPGHRVLDLGCGTAKLTILIKRRHPEAEVIGLDGDEKILTLAKNKIMAAGLDIHLQKGLSYQLDFPDNFFDRVLASLLFHHLTSEHKQRTLAEIHRVLKPGGELHIADWGKAQNLWMRSAFFLVQLLDGFATTSEHVQGKLLDYLRRTGFEAVSERQHFTTIFGTLTLYSAKKA